MIKFGLKTGYIFLTIVSLGKPKVGKIIKNKNMKTLDSIPKAISTLGFRKALAYSFGSWLTAWIIVWLTLPEAQHYLGQYGWIIPCLNSLAVFFKQYFDELRK